MSAPTANRPVGLSLEPLAARHIENVVRLHLLGFPRFFLSFLGPRFLHEFYNSFLGDPVGVGLVASDSAGQVLGAVVGPLDPRGYFGRLLRRKWWAFCLASVGAVVRRPSCVPRLFRAVRYRGEPPSGPARALLSSIVVSPAAQGRGVGKMLISGWVEEARRRGAAGCYLSTDADENEAVNSFYQRSGWQMASSYVSREGRRMNRYVLDW